MLEDAKTCGLYCSPQESQLLVIQPRLEKVDKKNIRVVMDDSSITSTTRVKILGLVIQENGKAGTAVQS